MVLDRVAVVLLNWNGFERTRMCMESLRRVHWSNLDIILVDNGSADGSGPLLRDLFPDAFYLQNGSNLGFARGCNAGIRAALARGADHVLLLNNDTVVEPGFIEPLVAVVKRHENVGLVSGKIRLLNDPQRLWYAGGSLSRFRGSVTIHGAGTVDDGRFDQEGETGACTGAMMFIPRRTLETVGLLPEEYFFGQEEWDYSLAVRRAGLRLFYCPRSVVHHEADGSHRNSAPKFLYCGLRNRLIFQAKYLPRPLFWVWFNTYALYVQHLTHLRGKLNSEALRAFRCAHRAAVRDHLRKGRLYVEEQDLLDFAREFEAAERRSVASKA